MTGSYSVSQMTRAELDRAVSWAAEEGWNPGSADADAFFSADPGGFFAGRIDGGMIASISVVKYDPDFAFLGFYIVAPEWRGHGHGKTLWDTALASAGHRTVGLDGVVAQQDNYRQSGFALAHNNIRFGGKATSISAPDPRLQLPERRDLDDIADFDRAHFPAERKGFLENWVFGAPDRKALLFREDGVVRGYGVIRKCGTGHKIGPLFAKTAAIAEMLFEGLISVARADEIFLDVPEPNDAAIALAARAGLEPVFETARMYRGDAPDLPLGQIFGITTFELG